MPKYRKIAAPKIEPRHAALLSRVQIETDLGAVVPYDVNAPGLYPDEKVVAIDGERVAVSVEPEWIENNAGVAFHGFARWLEDDGSTRVDNLGRPIETSASETFSHAFVELHGEQVLMDEVVKLVLGEDSTIVDIEVDPHVAAGLKENYPPELLAAFAKAGDDHTLKTADPAQDKAPIINLPPEVVAQRSIRNAIAKVKKIEGMRPRL